MSECTCQHCGHRFAAEPVAKHRVACGDATSQADLEALIAGEACELLACDPPYNVGLGYSEETDDNRSAEGYVEFTRRWFDAARAVTHFAHAARCDPTQPLPLIRAADCRERMGDIQGAKTDLYRALQLRPGDRDLRRRLQQLDQVGWLRRMWRMLVRR